MTPTAADLRGSHFCFPVCPRRTGKHDTSNPPFDSDPQRETPGGPRRQRTSHADRPASRRGGTLMIARHILVGHRADHVLHRGRSVIREWMSGSTSRRIVAHATCPVLVVRGR
ncbi:MAG: hypothetical protein GEU99_13395 [Luteitalea sp.]|nr:hypothetical protein [Luteitalea sp.]